MADTQFHPIGTAPAPADWTLPNGLDLLPKVVFAHFDGTASGTAYLPTLQIISDAGSIVAEIPQDASVAAGASVEATWAPFLKGTAAATAAVAVPYAIASGENTTLASGGNYSTISLTSGTFITSDPTIYSLAASGGFNGIKIATAGSYVVGVGCEGFPNAGVAAGSAVGVAVLGAGSVRFIIPTEVVPWTQRADGGGYQGNAAQLYLIEVGKPANPAGLILRVQAGQNTGGTADMLVYMFAAKLTTAIP